MMFGLRCKSLALLVPRRFNDRKRTAPSKALLPIDCLIRYDQSYMPIVWLTFSAIFFMLIGKMAVLAVWELDIP